MSSVWIPVDCTFHARQHPVGIVSVDADDDAHSRVFVYRDANGERRIRSEEGRDEEHADE